ncbi:hypothetical protein V6N12_068974 [Hibiscus sabdariffa]|uniref:Uncharacterized protein n=1 Tax=Hibiscus sabdariffa TaxID=183260 RepID=A0ABR2CAC4_9ROSI
MRCETGAGDATMAEADAESQVALSVAFAQRSRRLEGYSGDVNKMGFCNYLCLNCVTKGFGSALHNLRGRSSSLCFC